VKRDTEQVTTVYKCLLFSRSGGSNDSSAVLSRRLSLASDHSVKPVYTVRADDLSGRGRAATGSVKLEVRVCRLRSGRSNLRQECVVVVVECWCYSRWLIAAASLDRAINDKIADTLS